MINTHADVSAYWYYTGLIYQQFEGLMYGYSQTAPPSQVSILYSFLEVSVLSTHSRKLVYTKM